MTTRSPKIPFQVQCFTGINKQPDQPPNTLDTWCENSPICKLWARFLFVIWWPLFGPYTVHWCVWFKIVAVCPEVVLHGWQDVKIQEMTKLTHLLVHCALEVNLVDGDTGIAVLGTCTICQSAHGAGGKTHQGVGHSGLGAFSYWVARQYGVSTSCNQRGRKPTGWKMPAFTLRSICMDSGLMVWQIDLHISGESRNSYWQKKSHRV